MFPLKFGVQFVNQLPSFYFNWAGCESSRESAEKGCSEQPYQSRLRIVLKEKAFGCPERYVLDCQQVLNCPEEAPGFSQKAYLRAE